MRNNLKKLCPFRNSVCSKECALYDPSYGSGCSILTTEILLQDNYNALFRIIMEIREIKEQLDDEQPDEDGFN